MPQGDAPFEVWHANAPVRSGRDGDIRWSTDGQLLFGVIEVDEAPFAIDGKSGIEAAAAQAYAQLIAFVRDSDTPHLLRIWNYLDAITLGEGDAERYREFCVGRARGLGDFDAHDAARRHRDRSLRRCARDPGLLAGRARRPARRWRTRARSAPIVIRASTADSSRASPARCCRRRAARCRCCCRAPPAWSATPRSTTANCWRSSMKPSPTSTPCSAPRARAQPSLPAQFGPGTRLKVYVRDRDDMAIVAEALDRRLGDRVPRVLLHAAICRRELAVEIDGVHAAA